MTELRLNDTQRTALDALIAATRPLSAYDVLDALRATRPTAAPPTAYRALERLIGLGLAHRLESINAYVACCAEHTDASPLFAICDDCGLVDEVSDHDAVASLSASAGRSGFAPKKSVVELHGVCAGCQRGAA
ncbi:transcriptional repressor [Acuticoccus sp. MNP-M23]|uniref:transcriptional repressor n=1 Tax=Acuticoccus sp. MNP-M23 TaxID=3072793 RepID=UPI002815A088|nr:transcriptional repressor [Acuticoccus sp. MNP-M23]WMS42487.1 transcriptional repressor [Acuticoccus sp. MNP-M23]